MAVSLALLPPALAGGGGEEAVRPQRPISELEASVTSRLRATAPSTRPMTEPLRVRIYDLLWEDQGGEPILRADSLSGLLAPLPQLSEEVEVRELTVFQPDLSLNDEGREWNILTAWDRLFTRRAEEVQDDESMRVTLHDSRVTGGRAAIIPREGDPISFTGIEGEIPLFSIPGERGEYPHLELSRLDTEMVITAEGIDLEIEAQEASIDFPPDRVDFSIRSIRADSSTFRETIGTYTAGSGGLGLELQSNGERVFLADIMPIIRAEDEGGQPDGIASFELDLRSIERGRSSLELSSILLTSADGSEIHGELALAFGGGTPFGIIRVDLELEPLTIPMLEGFIGPLPYGGEIRGVLRGPAAAIAFDLEAALTTPDLPEPFPAELFGTARFTGAGFQLSALELGLRDVPLIAFKPFVPILARDGVVSGQVRMEGTPGEVPIHLDIALELAEGGIATRGTIDLRGGVAAYDLSGTTEDLDLQQLFEIPLPPLLLTSDYALQGRGTNPMTAETRVTMRGEFTGWETEPGDSIILDLSLSEATMAAQNVRIEAGPIGLELFGNWHYQEPTWGGLDYFLTTTSSAPLTPYIVEFDGVLIDSLDAEGTISGTISNPRLDGELSANTFQYGGWRAESLNATYDLTLDSPIESGLITLSAEAVETPVGPYTDLALSARLIDDLLSLDLDARGLDDAPLYLTLAGTIGPGYREGDLLVERLSLPIEGQEWRLAHAATIIWTDGGEGFEIGRLLLRQVDGPGELAVDGRYPPGGEGDLLVTMTELPVTDLLLMAGYGPILTGQLSLDLRARGPAAEPIVGGNFQLVDGSYRGEVIEGADGIFLAEDGRLDIQLTTSLDTAGTITADASLPFGLTLTGLPEITIPEDEPVYLTALANALSLRILTLGIPELRDVEGEIDASIQVRGTIEEPTLYGEARVEDAALTVIPLDQRYEEIYASLTMIGEEMIIAPLRARSDGWMIVTGVVGLADLSDPTFDLEVELDEFRALGADDLKPAAMTGNLEVGGSLEHPTLRGELMVDDGNLALPSFATGPELEPVEFAALPPSSGELEPEEPIEPVRPISDRIEIDELIITVGDDLWFVTDELRAELAGVLTVEKSEGSGPEISGTLEGDRGIFTLQVGPIVRRFTLVETTVRFFGTPEIDPGLDVTASRIIPGTGGQFTEILLHLTGTLQAPEVEVTTAEGAAVPESEILSFLLFGRPSFESPGDLGVGGPLLSEAVFGIGSLAEIASIGLEEAIISDLGLPIDYFLIQPTQGPLGGIGAPTIIIGQEIAPNLYLTINTGFGGLFGSTTSPATAWTVSLQWRITSQWTLELALEPVNPARFFRGLGTALPIVGFERQLILELRRRWTY